MPTAAIKTALQPQLFAPTGTTSLTPTRTQTASPTRTPTGTPTSTPFAPTEQYSNTVKILYVAGFEEDRPTCVVRAVGIDGSGDYAMTTSPPPFNCWRPRFSPDGTKIAFANHENGSMYVMNLDGSGLLIIVDSIVELAWSPDSRQLVYYIRDSETQRGRLVTVNSDGGDRHIIGYPDVGICDGCEFVFEISWSPDGQWIYAASNDGAMVTANIFRVDGMEYRVLGDPLFSMESVTRWLFYKEWQILSAAAWSPDSQRLALPADPTETGCASLSILSLKEGSKTISLEDIKLAGEAENKVTCFWDNFYWSDDGQSILAYGYHPGNLVDSVILVISPDTDRQYSLGYWDGHPGMSVWSPDGSKLVFVSPAPGESFSTSTPLVIIDNVPDNLNYQILADSVKDYPGSLYWLDSTLPYPPGRITSGYSQG